jgi:dephospho-CoA kinase
MKIIGIAGTNGSGKDTVSELLAENGWMFISASIDLFIPELKKRGLPLEREQMAALSTEWRQQLAMGAVVDKALEEYKKRGQDKDYKGLVISSLRHPGEADRVHELGGQVVWVDADPKVRYQRIYNRGQGAKDQKTFEEFLLEEQTEMRHSGDEATLSIGDIKPRADIIIENSGDDIEAFRAKVKELLTNKKLL